MNGLTHHGESSAGKGSVTEMGRVDGRNPVIESHGTHDQLDRLP
jgi:hypothetical protein